MAGKPGTSPAVACDRWGQVWAWSEMVKGTICHHPAGLGWTSVPRRTHPAGLPTSTLVIAMGHFLLNSADWNVWFPNSTDSQVIFICNSLSIHLRNICETRNGVLSSCPVARRFCHQKGRPKTFSSEVQIKTVGPGRVDHCALLRSPSTGCPGPLCEDMR